MDDDMDMPENMNNFQDAFPRCWMGPSGAAIRSDMAVYDQL